MIQSCFTDKTNIFEIKTDGLIQFNTTDVKRFNAIAKEISKQTGVPKKLIYKAPYLFNLNHWHKIDGEWYFYKSDDSKFHFINELLGEVISNYFGLDTINYQVAKLSIIGKKEEYGLISKNFCDKKYTYKSCTDYDLTPRRDLSILEYIRNICQTEEEYQLLLDDLKKFFIRDFYTSQKDRTINNFLFKVTKEGKRLAPLYDYEYSFASLDLEIYRNQIAEINLKDKETKKLLRHDPKFQELLNLIINANMATLIEEVEDKHQILVPDHYKTNYKHHDSEIKRLILKHKLIK